MTSSHWTSLFKGIIYVGLFSLLITPFIVTDSLYFPFITGKAFFFQIVTEIIFGAWIILAIFNPEYRPKRSLLLGSIATFLLIALIANSFSDNPTVSFWSNFERMEGYVTLLHFAALVVVLGTVMNHTRVWRLYIHTAIVASTAMMISAFSDIAQYGFAYRIDTTLGNPIYLAVFMLINSFLLLWLIAQLQKSSIKEYFTSFLFWLYGILWILHVVVVFQTQTRGAMLGVAVGLGITFILTALFAKQDKPLRTLSAVAVIIMLCGAAAIFLARDTDFIKSIPALERLTTISASEGTGQARLWNWGIAWQGIKEKPLFGWGQGNYNIVFDAHYNPQMFEQEPWFDRAHNVVIDWAVSTGIVGVVAYLAIFVTALFVLWRRTEISVFEKSVLTGLLAGYFTHNLFVFDHTTSYILFAIVLAYIYFCSATDSDLLCGRVFDMRNKELLIVVPITFITIWLIYVVNIPGYVSARDVVSAIQLFRKDEQGRIYYAQANGLEDNMKLYEKVIARDTYGTPEVRSRLAVAAGEVARIDNIDVQIKNTFVTFAINQMLAQIESAPNDARYPYTLSGLYAQLGNLDQAVTEVQRAIDISPDKQIFHFLLARLYAAQNNASLALQSVTYAYELAPQFDRAWSQYATMLGIVDQKMFDAEITTQIAAGRFDRVETLIKENIMRKPDDLSGYVSLSALYFQQGDTQKALGVLTDAITKFPQAKVQLEKLRAQITTGNNPLGQKF